MGLSAGIVGLPNVGKSTLFNALTAGHAASSNYPFTTIEPNIGVVSVPDPRLKRLDELFHPAKLTPALASLVAGVKKAGITPEKFAGGHGSVADYAPLAALEGK